MTADLVALAPDMPEPVPPEELGAVLSRRGPRSALATGVPPSPSLVTRLSVSSSFRATHFTPLFPEGHPDREPHEHEWTATLTAAGAPDEYGMVINAVLFRVVLDQMVAMLAGKLLNDVLPHPTDEAMAAWLLVRARLWSPHGDKIFRCRVERAGQAAEVEV